MWLLCFWWGTIPSGHPFLTKYLFPHCSKLTHGFDIVLEDGTNVNTAVWKRVFKFNHVVLFVLPVMWVEAHTTGHLTNHSFIIQVLWLNTMVRISSDTALLLWVLPRGVMIILWGWTQMLTQTHSGCRLTCIYWDVMIGAGWGNPSGGEWTRQRGWPVREPVKTPSRKQGGGKRSTMWKRRGVFGKR